MSFNGEILAKILDLNSCKCFGNGSCTTIQIQFSSLFNISILFKSPSNSKISISFISFTISDSIFSNHKCPKTFTSSHISFQNFLFFQTYTSEGLSSQSKNIATYLFFKLFSEIYFSKSVFIFDATTIQSKIIN
jgi:hypothetical protein